jgi:hypothetical protein
MAEHSWVEANIRGWRLARGAGTSALTPAPGSRLEGDILLALPGGITIADISAIHPLSIHTLPAEATSAGAAAAGRDPHIHEWSQTAAPLCTFSVESYGRSSQPAMKLLHALGNEAAGPGGVDRASFVAGAFRKL